MDLICPKMPISTVVKKNIFLKNFWDLGTPALSGCQNEQNFELVRLLLEFYGPPTGSLA